MATDEEPPEPVNVDLECEESSFHFTRAVELAQEGDSGAALAQLLWSYGSLNKVVHGLVAAWKERQ